MKFLKELIQLFELHKSATWISAGLILSLINLFHRFLFNEFILIGIFLGALLFRVYEIYKLDQTNTESKVPTPKS